jgi:hypothetical protein
MLFSPGNCFTHIKCAITGLIISEIGVTIIARADYIQIFIFFSRGETARAGPVPVTLLIFYESPYEIFRELGIRVQEITPAFCLMFENGVGPVNFFFVNNDEVH